MSLYPKIFRDVDLNLGTVYYLLGRPGRIKNERVIKYFLSEMMGYKDLKGQNDWVQKKSPLTINYDNIILSLQINTAAAALYLY